jgi:CubicO group peptidase (beta-lactamase class C family)
MRYGSVHVCLFVLLALPTAAASEAPGLEAQVDAVMRPLLDEDLISGSILIAREGRIEVAKGYGPANREHDVPCTADTKYRLASMTKSFTAMAIMMLEERGLLSVDDKLAKYLPDYPQGDKITLHHLLTHTSGVVNYSALPDHYRVWTMPHTIDQVIERFRDEPLRFEPGTEFGYSNSGYVLLTYVIEKVSGKTYAEFLRENIFVPVGMNDTGVDSHTTIIPGRATGHYNFGEGVVQAQYLNTGFTSGAGSLYSTVVDLYKWDRALYSDKLVSKATLNKMFTPGKQDCGYGWFVRTEFDRNLIEHPGGLNGFLTMIKRFVDDDVVVISLFNYVSTFARGVNKALTAMALGESYEPLRRKRSPRAKRDSSSARPTPCCTST